MSSLSQQTTRLEKSLAGSDTGWSQTRETKHTKAGSSPSGTGLIRRPPHPGNCPRALSGSRLMTSVRMASLLPARKPSAERLM